ncbi:MAG: hypothetical protein ACKO0W_07170, partial [Planctomycetota bacterium]
YARGLLRIDHIAKPNQKIVGSLEVGGRIEIFEVEAEVWGEVEMTCERSRLKLEGEVGGRVGWFSHTLPFNKVFQ